jgi:hypothetical protein
MKKVDNMTAMQLKVDNMTAMQLTFGKQRLQT